MKSFADAIGDRHEVRRPFATHVAAMLVTLFIGGCASAEPRAAPHVAVCAVTLDTDAGRRVVHVSALVNGTGDGAPVVLVHGTPGDAGNWRAFVDSPPEGHPVAAVDRPGFGSTTPSVAVTSLTEQARALSPWLDAERPAVLVGHSLGAAVVMRAAVDAPDQVAALVLVAGSLDPDLEEVLLIQHLGHLVDLTLPAWLRHTNRELIALEEELRQLAARLAELRCPVVIVHGTDDGLVPYANVAFVQASLHTATPVEVITIEGGDHFLPWNAVEAVREAIGRAAELATRQAVERDQGAV